MNEIVAFNQTKADLATFKAAEEKLEFDCETPEGITKLRSHVYTLRQRRSAFEKLRVSTKAEALQACKNVDAQAKVILAGFTEMIDERNKPLKEIKEREEAEKQAALDKIRENREKEEADRLADLEAKEKELADLKAKEAERVAEVERAAREKKIAEDAKIEAEQEAGRKLRLAEEKRVADVLAEKQKAIDIQNDAEAEAARFQKIEDSRVADKEHRKKIEDEIIKSLFHFIGTNSVLARNIVSAMQSGQIPNVTINF